MGEEEEGMVEVVRGEGLSATGQRTQRGVAVQAAVRFRCHGGVAACVGGLGGHGRDVVDRGG